MTDTEADATGAGDDSVAGESSSAKAGSSAAPREKRRPGGLGRFLREVIAELRKVVYPSRQELLTYTTVVIVFVVVMMIFVSALDFGIARLMSWAFGG